jgi:autotransporter-associated beta strand protein
MHMSKHFSWRFKNVSKSARLAALLPAAAAVFLKSPPVLATSATWDGNASIGAPGDGTNWPNPDNWTSNGVVDAAPPNSTPGDDLTFGLGTVGQIQLQANRFANSLTFNAGFTLIGASDTLTLATGDITVGPGVSTAIDAQLAGTSGLSKLGDGTLTLYAADQYTGATTIEDGTLVFNANETLPSPIASLTNMTINSGSTVSLTGTSNSYSQAFGNLNVGGTLLLTAGTFNYNGGSVTGTVTLNNDSSFDAPTLSLNSSTVNSGTFQFVGALGDVNGSSVPSGVTIQFQPNPVSYSGGIIFFGASTATNSGNVELIGDPTTAETLEASGTFINSGNLTFTAVGSPSTSSDDYAYAPTEISNTATITLDAPTVFQSTTVNTGTINVGAKQLLEVSGGDAFYQNAGAVNLASGAVFNASDGLLYLNGGTITLSADPVYPASLDLYDVTFNATSGTGAIASSPVGPGEVPGYVDLGGKNVFFEIMHGNAAADVVVSAPITDGSIEKTDNGILLLTGRNSFTAATIDAGTLIAGAPGALPTGVAVAIQPTGTLQLSPSRILRGIQARRATTSISGWGRKPRG